MIIHVGTKNKAKIDAVKEMMLDYPLLKPAKVIGLEVDSGVSPQPITLEETIRGAMNRARASWPGSTYSFGLESGLMEVPYTKTGYMDLCAAAIYDGVEFHLGLSSVFEYPKEITRLVFEEGLDVTEAANKSGLTENPRIGAAEGVIGILTKGRLPRKDYTKQAIQTALIHLENPHLF